MNEQFPWAKQHVARLTELWNAGISASMIGQELGVSRNAVIGKVRRLKLPWRRPMKRSFSSIWTADKDATLRAMWNGNTCAIIAQAIGCSRSEVARRGIRIGLPAKGRPLMEPRKRAPKPPQKKPRWITYIEAPDSLNLHLMDVGPKQCRWPYGNSPYTFCGQPITEESSYCGYHHQMSREATRGVNMHGVPA